jgi:hypothetical protein
MNELLDAVHEAITRAVIETPVGQRSKVTEAVITTLHKALRGDITLRTRYQTPYQPGATVSGILVPTAFDYPGYRAVYTDDRETVLFSGYAKELREKLDGVPYGERLTITLLSARPGKVKEFDVRVSEAQA